MVIGFIYLFTYTRLLSIFFFLDFFPASLLTRDFVFLIYALWWRKICESCDLDYNRRSVWRCLLNCSEISDWLRTSFSTDFNQSNLHIPPLQTSRLLSFSFSVCVLLLSVLVPELGAETWAPLLIHMYRLILEPSLLNSSGAAHTVDIFASSSLWWSAIQERIALLFKRLFSGSQKDSNDFFYWGTNSAQCSFYTTFSINNVANRYGKRMFSPV